VYISAYKLITACFSIYIYYLRVVSCDMLSIILVQQSHGTFFFSVA
jgi:hypothetical protein